MTDTTLDSTLEVTQWENDYFAEYVRSNEFSPYTGTSANALIHVNENLTSNPGANVVIPLVGALSNSAVTGDSTLEGNEEALSTYGHTINAAYRRNAVRVGLGEQAESPIQLLNAGREMLMAWSMDDMRDRVISALASIDGVAYGTATEAQKDAWVDNNVDRIMFGVNLEANFDTTAPAGGATYDHSGSLALIDGTADKLTASVVSTAKRLAKLASPAIRPFRVSDNLREEWYVMFAPSYAFRDLKNDSTILSANREAWQRGRDNPIFRDGDLIYDGVIIREVPEIVTLSGVGAGSIDVAPATLCGAQAVGVGFKERTRAIQDTFDYGQLRGVGVRENSGVEKLQSNFGTLKDHGCATVYVANVGD